MTGVQRFVLGAALLAVSWSMAGCKDDDDDGGSAPMRCMALVEEVCGRARECFEQEEGLSSEEGTDFEAECVDATEEALDCQRAVAIDSSYSTCIDDIQVVACETLINDPSGFLPSSCNGVIKVR
jgi:hypothetical protein